MTKRHLKEQPNPTRLENLFAALCRPVGYEGHGGHIREEVKKESERIRLIDLFMQFGGDPNIRNRRKVTPLHVACRFDLPKVVVHLLQLGAQPDAYDEVRETPILLAVNLGYEGCLKALIAGQADVNFQNRKGLTPLQRAAMRGKRLLVPVLLDSGSDPTIEDKQGKLPLHYARNKQIREAIMQASASI